MTRSRLYIYIVAGGYVIYTGFGLAKNALAQRPDNYMMYLVIGVLFIAVGAFLVAKSAGKLMKGDDEGFGDDSDAGRTDSSEESGQEGGTDHEDRNGI